MHEKEAAAKIDEMISDAMGRLSIRAFAGPPVQAPPDLAAEKRHYRNMAAIEAMSAFIQDEPAENYEAEDAAIYAVAMADALIAALYPEEVKP